MLNELESIEIFVKWRKPNVSTLSLIIKGVEIKKRNMNKVHFILTMNDDMMKLKLH
jgi:hypothetical protein